MADIHYQLAAARTHLADIFPEGLTADGVRDALEPVFGQGKTISVATIGPKLRLYERQGQLTKAYFIGKNGRKQVKFFYNPKYHQTRGGSMAHADFLRDQKRDEEMFASIPPEVQEAAAIHRELMK